MAERGVSIELRGPDGRILPAGRRSRAQRVRDVALARMRAARSYRERLSVADDYASAAAVAASREGLDPSPELDRATRELWAVGDSLTRRLAEMEDGNG